MELIVTQVFGDEHLVLRIRFNEEHIIVTFGVMSSIKVEGE